MKTHQLKKKYAANLEAESWGSPPPAENLCQLHSFFEQKKIEAKKT